MKFLNTIKQFWKNEDGFIGGLIGAGLSLFGGKSGSKAAGAARQDTMMGFNYLKDNPMVQQAQSSGRAALGRQEEAGGLQAALLGLGGDQEAAEAAFDQYQDSTGYQFRRDQGMQAIEGSRAARGTLNSGAMLKDLTQYGQDIASQEFQNYTDQLTRERTLSGAEADTGLRAALGTGSAGSSAGGAAANATMAGHESKMSGIGGLVKGAMSIFGF